MFAVSNYIVKWKKCNIIFEKFKRSIFYVEFLKFFKLNRFFRHQNLQTRPKLRQDFEIENLTLNTFELAMFDFLSDI